MLPSCGLCVDYSVGFCLLVAWLRAAGRSCQQGAVAEKFLRTRVCAAESLDTPASCHGQPPAPSAGRPGARQVGVTATLSSLPSLAAGMACCALQRGHVARHPMRACVHACGRAVEPAN